MFRLTLLLVLHSFLISINFVICENIEEIAELVGVDTVHETGARINKDTIITRNLKLENRGKGGKIRGKDENHPDWSYNSIPQEISSYVTDFKRNMSECLKEVQAADTRPVKRMSPKTESPVHGECLIACVLKRNGVIEKGKVNKANLLSLVNKFFAKDTKLMKKLEKHVDSCIAMSARHKDECELAARLNACTNDLMVHNKHKLTVNY